MKSYDKLSAMRAGSRGEGRGGRLSAYERILLLTDEGSFHEVHRFASGSSGKAGDGVITGFGTVDGRTVFISSDDFSVAGGSLGSVHARKIMDIMDRAFNARAPYIAIHDTGGARIEEGIRSLAGYGGIFRRNVEYKGKIPQVALILGPAAGGASYSPALMDAIFLSKKHARMFLTGPDVTKKVTFEEHTAEELGGWRLHMRESGVAHYAYDDEKSCIEGVRRYLSYYSDSSAETICGDQSALSAILPEESRKPYDMHRIIETIFDSGSIMEERAEYAQNAITALARLDGRTVGIVADNPMHIAGSLDINASYKISSFIDFCSGAGFPVITFVDVPAFMPGIGQESGGIIRHGASIIRSYVSASVPLLTVIVRKAYGGAYIAMGSKSLGADFVYAWPSAEIAVMGKDGAKEILRKKHPDADEAELENYLPGMDPWSAENALQVDEVILPEETRERLTTALRALS